MYCIKVTPGSERIKVRQVASGFNPKYREAEANGKISDKRLAVSRIFRAERRFAPRAFDSWPFWHEKGRYKTNRPHNGKAPELDFCVLFLSHVDWDNEEGQTGQMHTERFGII